MLRSLLLLVLPWLAPCALAAELSGKIHSPTGALPAEIEVLADRADKLPTIAGTVDNGRYRITLPDTGLYRLRLVAKEWEAAPKYIPDPTKPGALDFLLYPARVPEPALAQELIRMGELDQEKRTNMPAAPDKAFWKQLEVEDRVREARLGRIIEEKGWPLISQVGPKAANSAWLVAQHGTPAFLKRCLVLMRAAADKNEMDLGNLALSIDRVLTNDGKKQLYGSQFRRAEDGRMVAFPIEDMAQLDERRATMGLGPFEEYRKAMEN
ncbi:DUF6624 domain-containing protein [Massilia niabensis]|uniref:DUF6624 domain-containing protein n=1 Tax=Massilia niabensis TaxID=544910 RepID=A0ABW0L268_9BURK